MKIQVGKTYRVEKDGKLRDDCNGIGNYSVKITRYVSEGCFEYDLLKENIFIHKYYSELKESDLILEDDINNPYVGMEVIDNGGRPYILDALCGNLIALHGVYGGAAHWFTLTSFKNGFKIKPQEEVKPWSPEDLKDGDEFYFVDVRFAVSKDAFDSSQSFQETMIKAGNCFKNYGKAQAKADEILKLLKS